MKKGSLRIYRIIRACCFFVFYVFLWVCTCAVSFAQEYIPLRNNKDTGVERRMVKYGVYQGRIKPKVRELMPEDSEKDVEETKETDEDSEENWKERPRWNNEVIGAYGVAVSEEPLKIDKIEDNKEK